LNAYKIPYFSIDQQNLWIEKLLNTKSVSQNLSCEIDSQLEILKKLRQSILQEAIEGKLTAKWRAENPAVEPASVLLEKIKAEKEKLVKEGKIKKEKPLPEIKADEIPFDIPESWSWCVLGNIATGFQYGTSSKSLSIGNIPVLRMGNIQNGKISWDNLVYTNCANEVVKYGIGNKDLLFNRTNSRELVGKTAIFASDKQAIFAGYLVRLSMLGAIFGEYVNYVMNSTFHRDWCDSVKSDALGQSNINATKLQSYILPLPPLDEQEVIVEKIENLFAMCDELEAQIKASKSNTEVLTQAILKEAFEIKDKKC
jgi:type I restriction enzyme, S subunit